MRLPTKPSAGVFVRIRIGDEPSDALVVRIHRSMCECTILFAFKQSQTPRRLQSCDWNFMGVSGTPMKCAGKLDRITLELGTQHLVADFVVANIQEQLILGQPRPVEYRCVLDLNNASLCVRGNNTPLTVRYL